MKKGGQHVSVRSLFGNYGFLIKQDLLQENR